MFDTILGFFGIILVAVYLYAGDKANYYCKYHLLNVRAELYGNTGNYIIYRIGFSFRCHIMSRGNRIFIL